MVRAITFTFSALLAMVALISAAPHGDASADGKTEASIGIGKGGSLVKAPVGGGRNDSLASASVGRNGNIAKVRDGRVGVGRGGHLLDADVKATVGRHGSLASATVGPNGNILNYGKISGGPPNVDANVKANVLSSHCRSSGIVDADIKANVINPVDAFTRERGANLVDVNVKAKVLRKRLVTAAND